MDMQPPQAPPAITQSAQQASVDAYNRLVAVGDALAAEQLALPELPDRLEPASYGGMLDALDAYWTSERRAQTADHLATVLSGLTRLGEDDGLLDSANATMARTLAQSRGNAVPSSMTVSELRFGDVPQAGALAIEDTRYPGKAVLFTADHGLEAFDSLQSLLDTYEGRVRARLAATGRLLGSARGALNPYTGATCFPVSGNPLNAYVERVASSAHDKANEAWMSWMLTEGIDGRDDTLAEEWHDALLMDAAFDIESVLGTRMARVAHAANEARLTGVPADVANSWHEAAIGYADALAAPRNAPLLTLAEFANRRITEMLETLGVNTAPENIAIRIDNPWQGLVASLTSLSALFDDAKPVHTTLYDLALQGLAPAGTATLSASDSEGNALAVLDDAALRELSTDARIKERYQAYLTEAMHDGPHAQERRERATDALAARMRMDAAEARLSYYLPDEPRSFRDDHAERGFHWVEAVLDSPTAAGRAKVEKHNIVVRQLTYKGTPLRDVVVLTVQNTRSVPTVVFYTPGAPDGIAFREFDDRQHAARAFLYHPKFRDYLLDRLPNEYATTRDGERLFAGSTRLHPILSSSDSSGYTLTEEPFDEREVTGDFFASAYDVTLQQALRDVEAFARGNRQIHLDEVVLEGPLHRMHQPRHQPRNCSTVQAGR
jgi:hypothetical protein